MIFHIRKFTLKGVIMAVTLTTPVAHFVEFLNGTEATYRTPAGKFWTTKEVNAYADQMIAAGIITEIPGDPYQYVITHRVVTHCEACNEPTDASNGRSRCCDAPTWTTTTRA